MAVIVFQQILLVTFPIVVMGGDCSFTWDWKLGLVGCRLGDLTVYCTVLTMGRKMSKP
jgi:hypothetical protein